MYLYYDNVKGKKIVAVVSKELIADLGEDYVIADLPKEEKIGSLCIDENNIPYYDGIPRNESEKLKIENEKLRKELKEDKQAQLMANTAIFQLANEFYKLKEQINNKEK